MIIFGKDQSARSAVCNPLSLAPAHHVLCSLLKHGLHVHVYRSLAFLIPYLTCKKYSATYLYFWRPPSLQWVYMYILISKLDNQQPYTSGSRELKTKVPIFLDFESSLFRTLSFPFQIALILVEKAHLKPS